MIARRAGLPIDVLRRVRGTTASWFSDVVLTSDGAGWILDRFCRQLRDGLRGRLRVQIARGPIPGLRRHVVHLVVGECFFDSRWRAAYHPSNRMIGLWWHGSEASSEPHLRRAALGLRENAEGLARVHVTCDLSREIVRRLGVPEHKIELVPMGVSLDLFGPPAAESDRQAARRRLGIPEDRLVVGLFQKDGVGWGDGDQPKLIKGPDIFVEVVARLADRHRVFGLVPGPARGYITRALSAAGIPYRHDGHVPLEQLAQYYRACDVYVIPGREEGGPAALLESMATGTPLVAHRVGMAPDVIQDGRNGYLVDVGDVDGFVEKTSRLLADRSLRDRFSNAGLETVRGYDWPLLARRYGRLYAALLERPRAG